MTYFTDVNKLSKNLRIPKIFKNNEFCLKGYYQSTNKLCTKTVVINNQIIFYKTRNKSIML